MNGDSHTSRDSGKSRDYYSSRPERRDRGDRSERDRDRGERADRVDRVDRRDRGERRRSRSPHHRYRRSEADSYSSSRDFRAREREDRYSRRDDRDWDRERRRDHRRDDEGVRRDRDLFEERPRKRDRERKRSATPPARKREPTPDLTDVVPITERKRRLTQWDIKPPGYENVTAEQAKLSGMFPLPGAPRQQTVDPTRLQAFMNQPAPIHMIPNVTAITAAPNINNNNTNNIININNSGNSNNNVTLKPTNARQAKRLFVENVPDSVTEESLVHFINLQLNGLNVIEGVDPCVSSQFSKDRKLGMLEFKSAKDATVALAFDGIQMEEHAAQGEDSRGLSLRRPKDYIVPAFEDTPFQEGTVSSEVPDSPRKICITNIPPFIPEDQVTSLLVAFGALKSFVLVKDKETGESRGIAFCEYADPSTTSMVLEHLNGMELSDVKLKLRLASIGLTQASGFEMNVNAMSMFAKTTSQDLETGRVLQLLNMVTPEELMDNDDYAEILEDVQDECSKYGTILELKIPRPSSNMKHNAGVGKIFVKFDTQESAEKALRALAGRKFSDRTVISTYFSEVSSVPHHIVSCRNPTDNKQENFDVGAW
ncbi:hypothetical protein KEM54_003949 [Ascosphaera aggregata]|nr:hypothetical protein KEM54_003949 [Ascosphaera aggregata]